MANGFCKGSQASMGEKTPDGCSSPMAEAAAKGLLF